MGEDSEMKEEEGCFFSYNFLFIFILYDKGIFFFPRPQKKPTLSFLFLNIFITGVSAF